jgi:hypothetical protein
MAKKKANYKTQRQLGWRRITGGCRLGVAKQAKKQTKTKIKD